MYNDIIAGLTIAGTFFTAGFIGAVWDFKRVQRKKSVKLNKMRSCNSMKKICKKNSTRATKHSKLI